MRKLTSKLNQTKDKDHASKTEKDDKDKKENNMQDTQKSKTKGKGE